jgi:hypothetical protein
MSSCDEALQVLLGALSYLYSEPLLTPPTRSRLPLTRVRTPRHWARVGRLPPSLGGWKLRPPAAPGMARPRDGGARGGSRP